MATKQVIVPELGTLELTKRKGSRSIRLSITPEGTVRVSLPTWLPYQSGINFAKTKANWIAAHKAQSQTEPLEHGQAIGKAHHLILQADSHVQTISSRLRGSQAVVTYPAALQPADPKVQKAIRQVAVRALRSEAEALLPRRLQTLAQQGGLTYKSVQIKQLKRRWGSCNQSKEIVLNLYLMQLPWQIIDYVIWHELSHTKYLHHGDDFWTELTSHVPAAKQLRRQIREHRSVLV